jgi:hypothetical protein
MMKYKTSRFYVHTTKEDLDSDYGGYAVDVAEEEADEYEKNLKLNKEDYLRIDL